MEPMIRKYQRKVRKKTRQYFLTLSAKRRAELAGEIEEAEQVIRLLQNIGRETPEGKTNMKYETRARA